MNLVSWSAHLRAQLPGVSFGHPPVASILYLHDYDHEDFDHFDFNHDDYDNDDHDHDQNSISLPCTCHLLLHRLTADGIERCPKS